MDDGGNVELRTECPRDVVDVLDAISTAQRLTRGQLVVRILGDWARERLHEHSMLARIRRGNPAEAENGGRGRG